MPTAVPPIASAYTPGRAWRMPSSAWSSLRYPAGDQLAESERGRVLKVRAPYHDDIAILLRFRFEHIAQAADGRKQVILDCLDRRRCASLWGRYHWRTDCDSHRRWDELASLNQRRRLQVGSHDWRSPRWRSCWSACRNRSGRQPAEIRHPIGRRSLPVRHERSDRLFPWGADPVRRWPRRHISSGCRGLE